MQNHKHFWSGPNWKRNMMDFFVFTCLNEFQMIKWLQKWIDQPQIIYKICVTIVSRTNSYFAIAHSVFQDGSRQPFWTWAPHRVCLHIHNRHPSWFFYSTFMDDKSIKKTTSTLNGYGIAGDDPTNCPKLLNNVFSPITWSAGSGWHNHSNMKHLQSVCILDNIR